MANKNVAYNTKIEEPSRPSRGGYIFKGWYENETLTKAFDFNTPIVENITLYAKWSISNLFIAMQKVKRP